MSPEQPTKRYFKFTVAGQYIALHDAGARTLKKYECTFTLPSQEAALSLICKHLLDDTLRKKYPDYIHFRTHSLVSQEVVGRAPNREVLQMGIEDMTIEDLSDFCILRGIMIDPYKHAPVSKARDLILKEWANKRAQSKEKLEAADAAETKEVEALRQLNALPPEEEALKVNVNDQIARAKNSAPVTPAADVSRGTSPIPGEDDASPLPPIEPEVSHGQGAFDIT